MNTIRPFRPPLAPAAALPAATAAAQQAPASRLDTRLAAPAAKGAVPVDRIVAVVNDEVITANELSERTRLVAGQLRNAGGPAPRAGSPR